MRAVINDRKTPVNAGNVTVSYMPQVTSVTDYYSFGSQIAERTYDPVKPTYRFGFNTQEKVFEITQDHYTAKFWEYDARLGRRWNVDPKPQVGWSNYGVLYGNPIKNMDWLGDKPLDDYKIYASGKIERTKTNDKFDRFYYVDNDNKERLIGQYDKFNVKYDGKEFSMIKMPAEGEGFKFIGKEEKQYLRSEAAAGFLGAAISYNQLTNSTVYVTQFSTIQGGHSSHSTSGRGDFIDVRYIHKKDKNEPVWTNNPKVFDYERSFLLINTIKNFGYDKKSPNSILTENPNKTGPMFPGTGWDPGKKDKPLEHRHHFHLQHFNLSHIMNKN